MKTNEKIQLNESSSLLTNQSFIENQVKIQEKQKIQNKKKSFIQRTFGPIRKGALRAAILTLLASSMGPGIFNLPKRTSQIGLIFFIIFVIVCALYSYFGMKMISQIMLKHKFNSYSEMSQRAYGSVLKRISQFCLIMYSWGLTVCFQVILARFIIELLYDTFQIKFYDNQSERQKNKMNATGNLVRISVNFIAILLGLFCILKRQIDTIKKIAPIGVVSVLFNVIVVIVTSFVGFTRYGQNHQEFKYNGIFQVQYDKINWFCSLSDVSIILQTIAAIFFCYASHQMVFPLIQDIKNPTFKRLNKVFIRTHYTLLIVYTCVGILAYLLLSQHSQTFIIQPLVIASITTTIMKIGKLIMVLALFVAVSMNMFPARQNFVQAFQIDTNRQKNHVLVCVGMSLSSTLIAVSFVQVNSYFGLLGGTAGVMMAGGIPAMCYYKLMKLKRKHYFMLFFIFIMTISAFIGAIMSVVDLFK